jgi:NADP-dependent 3-hydroxy acid dehydrogenase YdfG
MALFSGQTILVTGASGGVWEAITRALGEQGAMVCLSGRDEKRWAEIVGRRP